MKSFRNFLALNPFVVVALLSLSSADLAKMDLVVSNSAQDTKLKLTSNEDFDSNYHTMETNYIIGLIWRH